MCPVKFNKLNSMRHEAGYKISPKLVLHNYKGRHTLGHMLRDMSAGTSPLVCTALAHVAGAVRTSVRTKRIEA